MWLHIMWPYWILEDKENSDLDYHKVLEDQQSYLTESKVKNISDILTTS